MTAVMIGVDPHKGSHTAVAVDGAEEPLGKLRVRASASQAQRLVAWAAAWPQRTWAVEGASGLGHLLAQQLVAAFSGRRALNWASDLLFHVADLSVTLVVAVFRSCVERRVLLRRSGLRAGRCAGQRTGCSSGRLAGVLQGCGCRR